MRIIFKNSMGDTLDLSRGYIRAVRAEGITPYSTISFAESSFYDGAEFISEYSGVRKIVITAVFWGKDQGHIHGLNAITGASGAGRLIFDTGSRKAEAACYTECTDIAYECAPARIKLTFLCLSPFFETDSSGGNFVMICGTQGRLEFPWEIHETDNVLSELVGSRSVLIENRGNIESGCVITADVIRTCSDIKIVNADTGEYIEMSGEWQSGCRLIIDTRSGRKGVECIYPDGTHEDVIYRLKWGSDFFSLPVGKCRLYAASSQGNGCLSVTVYFSERYRGIV